METERLFIVVVNYGSTDLLIRNLSRVVDAAQAVNPEARAVVVDNWSGTAERRLVRAAAADYGWELVESSENLGFGGGVNAGVSRALELGASDVLVINPDAWIDELSVRRLKGVTDQDRTTLVSPVVKDVEGAIWFAGTDLLLEDGTMRAARKRSDSDDADFEPWLSGACLWITREVWELSGGFDHAYFLYWEDVDFSRRVIAAGGGVRVVEDAFAVHDEGGTQRVGESSRAKSEVYYYYNIRNRMLFAVRHLDQDSVERWRRSIPRTAREVILRGGRRQFLHSLAPVRGYLRGVRDARRIAKKGVPTPN